MSEHDIEYKHGDRIEMRHDEQSPWLVNGKIVGPTLPSVVPKQWMVTVDGEHFSRPVLAIHIRRAP